MAATHAPMNWFAGDDWEIRATLLDENGNPFDLRSPAVVLWALMTASGERALDEDDVAITLTDPTAGKCTISVPAAKTSPLPGGQYRDVIRIVISATTSTLATGPIYVASDPWIAEEVAAASRAVAASRQPLRRVG
jgi:hypothetical protein